MKIKAVIFDFDNTLLSSELGYKYSLDKVENLEHSKYLEARKAVKERLPKNSPSSHNRLLYFKKMQESSGQFSAKGSLKLMEEYETLLMNFLAQKWSETHYADLLQRLSSKYKIGILTNENLRTQLQKLNIIDPQGSLVHAMLTSEECGYEKPHENMFSGILSMLNVKVEEAVFVGDSVHDDIEPALQLGFAKVFHTTEYSNKEITDTGIAQKVISLRRLSEIENHL